MTKSTNIIPFYLNFPKTISTVYCNYIGIELYNLYNKPKRKAIEEIAEGVPQLNVLGLKG